MNRNALLATSALAILASPLIVHAQAAPGPARTATGDSGEVVVHANRRAERLRDVAESVTVVHAQALTAAGITKTTQLGMVTPGLQMFSAGNYLQPIVRGIGSNGTSGTQAHVATYVDNAYQGNVLLGSLDLPDVESVEVLKGPQGTLFGRNATGGAILITTRAPNLEKVEGVASVSYGNFNSTIAKGFVSVPIIQDRLALSLTGMYDWTDGWKKDIDPDKVHDSNQHPSITDTLLRAKLRFIPWQGADFTLTGFYSRRDDRSTGQPTLFLGNDNAKVSSPFLGPQHAIPGVVVASKPWTYSSDFFNSTIQQHVAVTLHGDIDAGPGKFSLTSYYEKITGPTSTDIDNSNATLATQGGGTSLLLGELQTFTQEVLYTTNQLGPVHAVVGGYYFTSRGISAILADFPLFQLFFGNPKSSIDLRNRDEALAGFGELTYNITDRLSVTGGVRYNHENIYANGLLVLGQFALRPPTGYGRPDLHKTYDLLTPRFSLLFKVTPRTNFYATVSKGFTSGAFNASLPGVKAPVQPEQVWAYEGGIKSNPTDNLSASASVFYYDYSNFQTSHTVFLPGSGPTLDLGNAPKAQIYGVELNAQWRATENLDITAGATIMSAKYTDFPFAPVGTPIQCNSIPGITIGGLCGNTNGAGGANVSGTQMIRSPTFSGNLTADYHRDFSLGHFDASATAYFSSKVYWDFGQRIPQNPYALLNGSISFIPQGTNLKLSLWANNITNAAVISAGNFSNTYDSVDYQPPRTFGVMAEYRF